MLGLWISSNRQQTVAYGRHKVVGGYLYCLHRRVSLQMMIETIAQRTGKVVCTFCGLKKCTMVDYLKPKKYLIFSGEGVQNRVFWNNALVIGPHLYSMVGVTKYSPGHFYCDVYDPASKNWLHLNTIAESKKDVAQGFTLKPILEKRRRVLHIEGLIKDVNCVHYVRIQ